MKTLLIRLVTQQQKNTICLIFYLSLLVIARGCFPEGGKISKGGNTCTVFPLFLPREFEFLCSKHTAAYWCQHQRGGIIRRLYYSYVEMGRNGMTTDDQNLK